MGTFAPRAWKDLGSRRNSTISCSSALASSTPAISAKVTRCLEAGLICCGLTFGITFNIRHITMMITVKKRIATTGCQLVAQFWISVASEVWTVGIVSWTTVTGV